MFLFWIPLFLAFGFVQALADLELDPELQRTLDLKELELLSKLLSSNDTSLPQETKTQLAQYLIMQALEMEKKRQEQEAPAGSGGSVGPAPVPVLMPSATTEAPATSAPSSVTVVIPSVVAPQTAAPITDTPATVSTRATTPAPTRSTPSQQHVFNQVDKILQNVGSGNVVGIVDESLAIGATQPVRNLVNGILTTVFCNPIDRLFNRCRRPAATPNRTFG